MIEAVALWGVIGPMFFYSLLRSLANMFCMAALFTCIWLTNSASSSAGFLLSNLATDELLNTAGSLSGFEASGAISVGFRVLTPMTLSSVEFRLRANTGSSATKDATLVLRDDNAGNPGAKLADFNAVALGTSFQTASFNPTTNVVLATGSIYWLTLGTTIVVGGDGDGLVAGSRNPAINPSGTDGEFVGLRFGTPETQISSPLFTDAPSIQINITAVPEPTALGLAGLATVVLLRHIKRRRTAE